MFSRFMRVEMGSKLLKFRNFILSQNLIECFLQAYLTYCFLDKWGQMEPSLLWVFFSRHIWMQFIHLHSFEKVPLRFIVLIVSIIWWAPKGINVQNFEFLFLYLKSYFSEIFFYYFLMKLFLHFPGIFCLMITLLYNNYFQFYSLPKINQVNLWFKSLLNIWPQEIVLLKLGNLVQN